MGRLLNFQLLICHWTRRRGGHRHTLVISLLRDCLPSDKMVGHFNPRAACLCRFGSNSVFRCVARGSQSGLTSLRGTITDSSDAVTVGAQVTVNNETVGFHASRITDSRGHYEFPQIIPGNYTINLECPDGRGTQARNRHHGRDSCQPAHGASR